MSSIPLGTRGWIYALVTESHPYVKLGCTTLHPEVRAFQLTNATAAPHPFIVLHCREVADCNEAEARLHEMFDDRRVSEGREFFDISYDEAGMALDAICGDRRYVPLTAEPVATPWANLFAAFPDDETGRPLTETEQAACRSLAARLKGFEDVD